MAEWEVVAEGKLSELGSTVGELSLPKGSKMRVNLELTLPVGYLFNVAGAELLFRPMTPEGCYISDVWGSGSKAYIEMVVTEGGEVDGIAAWQVLLGSILTFIRTHWVAIVIGTFVLGLIVATAIVLVKISVASSDLVATLAIIGGMALAGVVLIKMLPPRTAAKAVT